MIDFETMLPFSPIAGEARRTRKRAGESIKGHSFETQAVQNYSPSPKREGGTSYCMGLAIFGLSGYKRQLRSSPKEIAPVTQGGGDFWGKWDFFWWSQHKHILTHTGKDLEACVVWRRRRRRRGRRSRGSGHSSIMKILFSQVLVYF